ncbi:DUF4123 domain-containing protein [Pseudomonas sp. IT-P12]|uniref:DUF4123 domain-containing protein n=1 Tax=Pseudomonas sp. IT-P12 TaxID=3026450 RepID=UPI0039DF36B9
MQPERLSPYDWLLRQPLAPGEQVFAVFGEASSAEPFNAWCRSSPVHAPTALWSGTAYAEWRAVMPYVALVDVDGGFLQWVATTTSADWGWLLVSSVPQEQLVEHLRSLTQVLLPDGRAVFFRFWDGRFLRSIIQCAEVDAPDLLPAVTRCLINGQGFEIGAGVQKTPRDFPWWRVPDTLLEQLGEHSNMTLLNNLLQWLSEERPDVFEAFSESVLRRKVANFLAQPGLPPAPESALVAFLAAELG